ncbi:hypothetical protein [Coleofasciculus sp. E2-BRE-01]
MITGRPESIEWTPLFIDAGGSPLPINLEKAVMIPNRDRTIIDNFAT